MKFKVEFKMMSRFCPNCPFFSINEYDNEEGCILQNDKNGNMILFNEINNRDFKEQLKNCPLIRIVSK